MTDPLRRTILITALAAPVALAAGAARAATHDLTIKGMAFSPKSLAVAAGDTVVVTNLDSAPHTCTADGGAFETPRLKKGQTAEITIAAAGSFPFHCAVHSGMKGVIIAS